MLAVEFALLFLGTALVKANRVGLDGEECNPNATLCDMDNRMRHAEHRLGHCMERLMSLGEFQKMMIDRVAVITRELKELKSEPKLILSDQVSDSEMGCENVTALMNRITEEQASIRNLSGEIEALQNEKKSLRNDLESEKRYRRSLSERVKHLDEELKETRSWKPMVEDIRVRLDDLTNPTQNLSAELARLMEERDTLKSDMERERNVLRELETHIYLLETELNKTNSLKVNVIELHGKMNQLEANIANETVDKFKEIIETRLANIEPNNKTMEEKLKVMYYDIEDKQNSVSNLINHTLNNRVSKMEQLLATLTFHQNNATELCKSEISALGDELNRSTEASVEETARLWEEIERLKETTTAINLTLLNHVSRSTEEMAKIATGEKRMAIQLEEVNEWQKKIEQQYEALILELSSQMEHVEILERNVTYLLDDSSSGNNLNQSNTIVIDNNVMMRKEFDDFKEEFDVFRVFIENLNDDWDRNWADAYSIPKVAEGVDKELGKLRTRVQKLELALKKTINRDEFLQHDEKIVRLFMDVSMVRSQSEELKHEVDANDIEMSNTKNWAAEYVDRECKTLEKKFILAQDNLMRTINRSVELRMEEARTETKKIASCCRQEIKTIPIDENSTLSDSAASGSFCVPNSEWDPNLVISYKFRSFTPLKMEKNWSEPLNDGEELVFRCSHVGRYLLLGSKRVVCREGVWSSDPPTCKKLPDEDDIVDSRDYPGFCKAAGEGHHLFPLNCNQYYNCMENTFRVDSCPIEMFFDNTTRKCVHRQFSDCEDSPAIDFYPVPGTPDIPIGITDDGTLVVYPGVDLILDCIRPIELEAVEWITETKEAMEIHASFPYGDKITRLELKNVSKSNSNTYFCIKADEREKNHSIRVEIKKVSCPKLTVLDPLRTNSSTPNRLNSRVFFSCVDNYILKGPSSIECQLNGQWSSEPPECQLKGCPRPDTKKDSWITLSPELSFYPSHSKVNVSCKKGAPASKIPAAVRCLPGGNWSISPFPTCLN